jgi:hypothetical protein
VASLSSLFIGFLPSEPLAFAFCSLHAIYVPSNMVINRISNACRPSQNNY